MRSPLPTAAVLCALLLPVGAAAGDDGPAPAPSRYAVPAGWAPAKGLSPELKAAADRAVAAVTSPTDAYAAREGWRILAGIGPGAAPAAIAALDRSTWFGRALLVRALGSMEDAGLAPVLVEAARDPAWAVREAAAEGLGLAASGVPEGLLPALLRDPSWRVRAAAVEAERRRALGGRTPREDAARAIGPLAADEDLDVARAALLALADLRVPAARPVLLAALLRLEGETEEQGTADDDPEEESLRIALRLLRGVAAGAEEDAAVLDHLFALGGRPEHPLAGAALREWCRLRGEAALRDPEPMRRLLAIFFWRGGAHADSLAAVEDALVEIGEPSVDALMAEILYPERPVKDPLPFDPGRRALHLALRIEPLRTPEILARVLRGTNLKEILRMHAASLGRRSCPVPLGPVFREVFDAEGGGGGLAANLLRGIAASGGDDVKGIVARNLVNGGRGGPPSEVRVAAAECLDERASLRDPGAIARALAAETDAEVLLRLLPVAAATLGDGAPRAVARSLGDRRMRVRHAAAGALSRCPGPEATGLLLAAVALETGDDDRLPTYGPSGPTLEQREELRAVREANAGSVRAAAISSLRIAAGPRAPAILRGLLRNRDPEVRTAAAGNLCTLGDRDAAPALVEAFARETNSSLREGLLTVVAALGGPAADAAFERLLASEDEAVRIPALRALGAEPCKAAAPEGIRRCLERSIPAGQEREAAVLALGRTRAPGAAAILAAMLAGEKGLDARQTILQVLGWTRDPAAVPAVVALLSGREDVETEDMAVEVLGELRAAEAVVPLANLLRAALPEALSGSNGRAAAAARQRAHLCIQSLGRCGGAAALDALAEAAFDRGFSRGAETATVDVLLRRPPRREDERWRPDMPDDLRETGYSLAVALARWKDAELVPALARRIDLLARDGSAWALSQEWLCWLGTALAEPSSRVPNRPRWGAKVLLLRQAVVNPPRMSEADGSAFDGLFLNASEVAGDYAAARRALDSARACRELHDPVRADREARLFDALGIVVDAAGALRASGDGAAAAESFDRAFAVGREDRVARLVVEVLGDMKKEPALALRFAELAVRAEGTWSSYWPNLRCLGMARMGAGDFAGAAEALTASAREQDGGSREPARSSAWTRFHLAKALIALGNNEEALAVLGEAALLNDVTLDWIQREPTFEPLRAGGRLDERLEPARKRFAE